MIEEMTEAKARKIVNSGGSGVGLGLARAEGYLEAIEKAKGLEVCYSSMVASLSLLLKDPTNHKSLQYWKDILAKYQGEK